MPATPHADPSLTRALDAVAGVLADLGIAPPGHVAEANARALAAAYPTGSDGVAAAAVAYAAELVGGAVEDLAARPDALRRVVDALQTHAAVPPVALGRELLRARRPAELSLLRALTGARAVSVWAEQTGGERRLIAHAGEVGDATTTADQATVSHPIAARSGVGVLALHGVDAHAPELAPLLAAAQPGLAALLERETVRDREQWRELVTGAVERRLARVRFDLHDGPQQDVILLAHDVRLFRDQLRPLLEGSADRGRALGRLDDFEAQLLALDGDLRRLSTSVQSPFVSAGSLVASLTHVAGAFAKRTGIVPETDFSADLSGLSESQEIALLALVQEALSNVRKHGEATAVQIAIVPDPEGIRAQVTDDGRGFDPETTAARAARAGRLGLVGMHERMRMLGGQTQIESRPGGPTVVSAVLPRWSSEED
ncbi:MAG TPA: ATP-binding protein [Solirubrobacteraceae bacterium]|nr:ATP-binding protein [Solirubrobacteraceae bacterium]